MGLSRNNRVELIDSMLILLLAHSKGVQKIQIFGDLKLVVDMMSMKRP